MNEIPLQQILLNLIGDGLDISSVISRAIVSTDSIMITDVDLIYPRIVFINDTFSQLTGYNDSDILGLTPKVLQGPDTDMAVLDKLRDSLMTTDHFTGKTINYKKDGTPFMMEWSISPILINSKPRYYVSVHRTQ